MTARTTPINAPADPPPMALGPVEPGNSGVPASGNIIPAKPIGRYTAAQVSFADAVASAQEGDKYNLDDEIVAVRAQLSVLQERLIKFLDRMDDDESKVAPSAASVITKAFEAMLRRLGELLALSAKMEGQVSILRVRAWAANLMRIIREEAKDDELCRRIARRLGNSII